MISFCRRTVASGRSTPASRPSGPEIRLARGPGVGAGDEMVPLVAKAEVSPLLKVVEECHALADQLDLLEVVELQPKGTRGDGRGEGGQRGPFFQDDRPQTGALGEE